MFISQSRTFLFNPKQDRSKTFQFGIEIISAYAERFYLIPKKYKTFHFGPELSEPKQNVSI